MGHDLAAIDILRERMQVTYEEAMAALEASDDDVVRALAALEGERGGGLQRLEEQVREGVKRGLSGQELGSIRWKLLGQTVKEIPAGLVGISAVVVGLLCLLVTASTLETEFTDDSGQADVE